jgi:hypothetical protein
VVKVAMASRFLTSIFSNSMFFLTP